METKTTLSFRSFLPAALMLAIVGWGGLVILINQTVPTLGPRWLFFFLVVLAVTGTILPVIVFLHIRFPSQPPVADEVILRQSIWFGAYAGALAWLQLDKVMSPALAGILAGVLILIEALLRLWERSHFKPEA